MCPKQSSAQTHGSQTNMHMKAFMDDLINETNDAYHLKHLQRLVQASISLLTFPSRNCDTFSAFLSGEIRLIFTTVKA